VPQLLCDLRPKDLIFSRSTAYKEGKWVRPVCLLLVPPRAPAFRSSPGVQGQLPAPLSTSRAPSLAPLLRCCSRWRCRRVPLRRVQWTPLTTMLVHWDGDHLRNNLQAMVFAGW